MYIKEFIQCITKNCEFRQLNQTSDKGLQCSILLHPQHGSNYAKLFLIRGNKLDYISSIYVYFLSNEHSNSSLKPLNLCAILPHSIELASALKKSHICLLIACFFILIYTSIKNVGGGGMLKVGILGIFNL